jgi:hypothetical protein
MIGHEFKTSHLATVLNADVFSFIQGLIGED